MGPVIGSRRSYAGGLKRELSSVLDAGAEAV